MNESYVTAEAKAQGILSDRYPGKELEKLYATTRNQATIDMLRDAVFTLITNEIPTCTIAEVLKKTHGAIQYHLRYLEARGKIKRPNKRCHWTMAEVSPNPSDCDLPKDAFAIDHESPQQMGWVGGDGRP
jgi:DNA-binding transcriptional ArsR family regulator